jgi:hypothetical protein
MYSTNRLSPAEFMILEEVWNIASQELFVLKHFRHLKLLRK